MISAGTTNAYNIHQCSHLSGGDEECWNCWNRNMPSVIAPNPNSAATPHSSSDRRLNTPTEDQLALINGVSEHQYNLMGDGGDLDSDEDDLDDCIMMESLNNEITGQDQDRGEYRRENTMEPPRDRQLEVIKDDDNEAGDNSDSDKSPLASPEIIETLKNLAACKEKLFKWEQSVANLESIPNSDPNKSHLMEIIDFVENTKSSTKEKAIYLYEQLGQKCRQHKNFIGAAKAYERAASLRLDVSDLNESGDNREDIVSSTIRYLESAILNYDAIHKFKHAGTLHYRCSRILKMINASHEEVDRHHEKALEYFTKPDHEFKHRKRVDGLKISCYSSVSTLQRMHHEIEKFHHTSSTTTMTHTTNHHLIKFHGDGCFRDSDDSDSNHSTTPPPSSSGSVNGGSSAGPLTPAIQFYGEDRHHYAPHHNADYFDTFMAGAGDHHSFTEPSAIDGRAPGGDVHAMEHVASGPMSSLAPNLPAKSSASARMAASSHSSSSHHYHHEAAMAAVKDHHHHYHHHHHKSSSTSHHQQRSGSSASSYSFQKSHHHKTSSSTTSATAASMASSLGMHGPGLAGGPSSLHNKTPSFRCIEDRIESARKLVKKLHKLCPFYEVSTNGEDAGRVYCRICDRYLGAVSSTLKNHVNTQEHRQAYEDSQAPPGSTPSGASNGNASQQQFGTSNSSSATPALAAPRPLPALPAPPPPPTTTNGQSSTPYPNNISANMRASREDLSSASYSGTGSVNSGNNNKQSYPESQAQPQLIQLAQSAGLPFMIHHQSAPHPSITYHQSLEGKSSHLAAAASAGKYMDFESSTASGAQQNGNWSQTSQNQAYGPGSTETSAAYLFNGSSATAGLTHNLLTFTDAGPNGGPGSGGVDASKHSQAMAVLMSQSGLSGLHHAHHPHHQAHHFAIPTSVLGGGAPGSANAVAAAAANSSANNNNSMPVLAYH